MHPPSAVLASPVVNQKHIVAGRHRGVRHRAGRHRGGRHRGGYMVEILKDAIWETIS